MLHWIEKRCSLGRILENLESSGTKIKIVGPNVACYMWEGMAIQTKKDLEDEFHVFLHLNISF